MDIVKTIIYYLLVINFVVLIHEYAHYKVARLFNVPVDTFSIGFGRAIKKWKLSSCQLQLGWLFIGGYVSFLNPPKKNKQNLKFYESRPIYQRFLIIVAGPLSNFLLAFVFLIVIFLHGYPVLKSYITVNNPQSPAALQHLSSGTKITQINNIPIDSWQDLRRNTAMYNNTKNLTLTVKEKNKTRRVSFALTTIKNPKLNVLEQLGISPWSPKRILIIKKITPGSSAEKAQLKKNDVILKINNQKIKKNKDFFSYVYHHPNQSFLITIKRGNQQITRMITPKLKTKNFGLYKYGTIGITLKHTPYPKDKILFLQYNWANAVGHACIDLIYYTNLILKALYYLITGQLSLKLLSSPLGIAIIIKKTLSEHFLAFLYLMVVLNINLGLLNILPIPALDGGHLLFLMIEKIRNKKIDYGLQEFISRVTIGLFMILIIFLVNKDINQHLLSTNDSYPDYLN